MPSQIGLFDVAPNPEIKYLMRYIDDLLKTSVSVTLQELFQQVINKMGILKYMMKQPDKGKFMQMLTNFFDFLKERKPQKPRNNAG
jgi:DNA helicase-2/ATP-dependent DNA helicase PcrA